MAVPARDLDPLTSLGDGAAMRVNGRDVPLPLAATDIAVSEAGGLAVVRTVRLLRNREAGPIEATLTFPVPGDAILTGLAAEIDGRGLVARAQGAARARDTYEAAIDSGRTAILHEEKMRGVHMLSLGNLPAGAEARVTVTYVAPLVFAGAVPALRVPVTVGEVYGRSPLLACDDLAAGAVRLDASVSAASTTALPQVLGLGGPSGRVTLDRAIAIAFPGWRPGPVHGRAADGRAVSVEVAPLDHGRQALDLTILFDRSFSTDQTMAGAEGPRRVWDAMRDGLRAALDEALGPEDAVRLVAFDSAHEDLGAARGPGAAALLDRIGPPRNGTEIGVPLIAAATAHRGDILLVTDGKSHALDVHAVAALGRRISTILVGTDALDAAVGHLAALTGGMTFVAIGNDVAGAARAALGTLRLPSGGPSGLRPAPEGRDLPEEAVLLRGGARLRLAWAEDGARAGEHPPADEIGRLAAGLALPLLSREAAERVALAHDLCTHLTSLVVIDEAGAVQEGLPAARKVPLMAPAAAARMPAAPPTLIRAARPPMPSPAPEAAPEAACAAPAAPATGGFPRRLALPAEPDEPFGAPPAARAGGGLMRRLAGLFGGRARRFESTDANAATGAARDAGSAPRPALPAAFDLAAAARSVDWDALAPRAEAEGLAAFPEPVRQVLALVARIPAVADLAAALGCTAEALAIALLARAAGPGNRSAARLARRRLKGGQAERGALRAVGLAA